jgi:hypothetical protein
LPKKVDPNRDRDIFYRYQALRDEGFTRDRAIDILKQSDYSYLSRSYIKRIIKEKKRRLKRLKSRKCDQKG